MKIKSLLTVLLLLLATLLPTHAAVPHFMDWALLEVSNPPLAEGLTLGLRPALGRGEEALGQRLHVLEIAPGAGLRFLPVSNNMQVKGLQTVPEAMALAARTWPGWTPVAAINGDFFDTAAGGALGLTIREGRLIQTGEFQGWSLGFTAQGEPGWPSRRCSSLCRQRATASRYSMTSPSMPSMPCGSMWRGIAPPHATPMTPGRTTSWCCTPPTGTAPPWPRTAAGKRR